MYWGSQEYWHYEVLSFADSVADYLVANWEENYQTLLLKLVYFVADVFEAKWYRVSYYDPCRTYAASSHESCRPSNNDRAFVRATQATEVVGAAAAASLPPPVHHRPCPFRCFRCRIRFCSRGAPTEEHGMHPMPHLCSRALEGLPCDPGPGERRRNLSCLPHKPASGGLPSSQTSTCCIQQKPASGGGDSAPNKVA